MRSETRGRGYVRWAMALVAIAVVMGAIGCVGEGLLVGPVNLTTYLSKGTLFTGSSDDKLLLPGQGFTLTTQEFACDFPTEEEINYEFKEQVPGIDITKFIRLDGMLLQGLQMQAVTRDFSFITDIRVTFYPAPVLGVPQAPIVLGEASNSAGFGATIDLTPPLPVDLLEIIRQNDSENSGGCPRIRYEITLSAPPTQDIPFELYTTLDVFALISRAQ